MIKVRETEKFIDQFGLKSYQKENRKGYQQDLDFSVCTDNIYCTVWYGIGFFLLYHNNKTKTDNDF